jgi:flagellar M-ring protein FliF
LTAAIVVNDRLAQPATKDKAAEWQSRSPEELRNLTALAQAAVGFDAARGDLLEVENLAFEDNGFQPPVSLLSKILSTAEGSPVLIKYAALFAGLLVVVAFGVRPALRHARLGSSARGGGRELPGHAESAAFRPPEPVEIDPARIRTQEIFEQVTDHLKREPTQSSRLLQSWIHSD